jgi:anti-sigma regulatory factor (Ser/Thr protein kinase)
VDEVSDERVDLRVPPRPEYVGTARIVVAGFARHHDFREDQIDDLKVAVSEAVTNAVRVHHEGGIDDAVAITAWMDREDLIVEIADVGPGFEPEAELGRTPPPGSLERGLGLTVIRSLFADTSFDRVPDDGMRLRIVAKREVDPRAARR